MSEALCSDAETILVVDDEPAVLKSVRRTLRSHGFASVLTASGGREALDVIREHRVALVLLDLVMPQMNGEELLCELRRLVPELPVVLVTAQHEANAVIRCMELGATDFLLKPARAEDLVATVRRTLEESQRRIRLGISQAPLDAPPGPASG